MFVSSETGRDVYEDLVEHNSRLQTVLEDKVIHNLTLKVSLFKLLCLVYYFYMVVTLFL